MSLEPVLFPPTCKWLLPGDSALTRNPYPAPRLGQSRHLLLLPFRNFMTR